MATVKKIMVIYGNGSAETIGEQDTQMDTLVDAYNWIVDALNGEEPGAITTSFEEICLSKIDYKGAIKLLSDQMTSSILSIGDASQILSDAYGKPKETTTQDIKEFRTAEGIPAGCPLHSKDPDKAFKEQRLEELLKDAPGYMGKKKEQ